MKRAMLALAMASQFIFAELGGLSSVLSYEGYLADEVGKPLSGSMLMDFYIYSQEEGGELLWTESDTVNVSSGFFSILLGRLSALTPRIFLEAENLFVEVRSNGKIRLPRKRLASVPHALVCDQVRGVANLDSVYVNGIKVIDENGEWIGNVSSISDQVSAMLNDTITLHGDVTGQGRTAIVTTISSGAVGSAEITDASIAGADIASASITSSHILDGTITNADLSSGISFNTSGDMSAASLTTNVIESSDTMSLSSVDTLLIESVGDLEISANDSGGADQITFYIDGVEQCFIDESGELTVTGDIIAANIAAGSNVSGTNTGDQTIVLTGDVTGSGTGSFAATLSNNTVSSAKIVDATITSSDISTGGVATANILDGTITGTDIASGTITSANILDGTVTGTDIASETVGSSNILDGTVTSLDISTGGVSSSNILDGTITGTDVASGTITSTNILDATITSSDISTGGVATANILDGTITGSDLASNITISTSGNIQTSTGNIKTTGGGCFGRTYVASSASSNGNAGGRSAADALCNTASSNSKVCTYNEMIESSRCGVTMPAAQGWINSEQSTDCGAWTSGLLSLSTVSWNTSQALAVTLCSVSQPFLCCK